jgi:hypothetical protein
MIVPFLTKDAYADKFDEVRSNIGKCPNSYSPHVDSVALLILSGFLNCSKLASNA